MAASGPSAGSDGRPRPLLLCNCVVGPGIAAFRRRREPAGVSIEYARRERRHPTLVGAREKRHIRFNKNAQSLDSIAWRTHLSTRPAYVIVVRSLVGLRSSTWDHALKAIGMSGAER